MIWRMTFKNYFFCFFKKFVLFVAMLFVFSPMKMVGQATDSITYYSAKADSFLIFGHLSKADSFLTKAMQLDSNRIDLKIQQARIQFERGKFFDLEDNLSYLMDSLNRDEPELIWLKASLLQHTFEFDDAIHYYKTYLRGLASDDPKREIVAEKILRAASGLRIPGRRIDVLVENMGPGVNTEADEIRPIFSPNSLERLYFSSNREGSTGDRVDSEWKKDSVYGHYPLDIFQASLIAGQFRDVRPLSEDINSPLNNIIMDFSDGGRVLFHFKGFSREVGRVFADTFGVSSTGTFRDNRLRSPFVPELGDKGLVMVNDSLMIFSSARPGGFGGYDLYISLFRDGKWLPAVNMGPDINSEWDEIDPFMTKGGRELFFSSNRLSSIGGFDIYHSHFFESVKRWGDPENIGLPISSAGNDRHFRIGLDGKTCAFSSDRKEGLGGFDLYLAYFRTEWEDHSKELSKKMIYSYFQPPPIASDTLKLDTLATDIEVEETDTVIQDTVIALTEIKSDTITEIEAIESFVETEIVADSILASFFYDQEGNILYESNLNEISKLARILSQNPEWKIILNGFSNNNDPLSRQLFFSIKRAEEIANELIDQEVDVSRIKLRAYGNQFPIEETGNYEWHYDQLNRRVDIMWFENGQKIDGPIRQERDFGVDGNLSELRNLEVDKGLLFRVQIAASRSLYEHEILREQIPAVVERQMDSDFYRYLLGSERTYSAASALMESIQTRGFENAFLVVYLDGRRLERAEINQLKENYPELKNFN